MAIKKHLVSGCFFFLGLDFSNFSVFFELDFSKFSMIFGLDFSKLLYFCTVFQINKTSCHTIKGKLTTTY